MRTEKPVESEKVQEDPAPDIDAAEDQSHDLVDESGAQSANAAEPSDGKEPQMFDPSALVGMAAMHMKTTELLQVLLTVFDAHAWRSMGLVADHTGEINKDLPAAQTSIDCLAFVLGKVEESLDEADRRDIQRRLTDLRMNYVAKVREG